MPALKISLDGAMVATVCTDGYSVVTANVGGTTVNSELASLHVSGGSYPESEESTHHIWANDIQLSHGQVLDVVFLENGTSSHAGKTIEELFPDEEPVTQTDFTWPEEMYAEIRAKQKIRDGYNFRLNVVGHDTIFAGTRLGDHGFGFNILWDSNWPNGARISLHTYSLKELETRTHGNYLARARMQFGDSAQFELLPFKSS